jgi:hypothetical protein
MTCSTNSVLNPMMGGFIPSRHSRIASGRKSTKSVSRKRKTQSKRNIQRSKYTKRYRVKGTKH